MSVIRKDPRLKKTKGEAFAKGKRAVAICQRSGFKYLQADMVFEPGTNILVHRSETDGKHNLVTDDLNFPAEKLREPERYGLRHPSPEYPMSIGAIVSADALLSNAPLISFDNGIHLDFTSSLFYVKVSGQATEARNFTELFTFLRSTTGTYRTPGGMVATAPINFPRVETPGLLVETSAANICLQSEVLGTTWFVSNSTVSSNVIAAPDGQITADKIIENSASATHLVGQAITTVADLTYTLSFWAKAAERTAIFIQMKDQAAGLQGFSATYDLTTGTVHSSLGFGAGGTIISTSIEEYADGWYRCTATGRFGTGITANLVAIFLEETAGTPTYQGDGASGAYVWGVQIEQQDVATSYIRTTTAIASRTKDLIARTIGSEYRTDEGTFGTVYTVAKASTAGNQFIARFSDTSFSNSIADFVTTIGKGANSVNTAGDFAGLATTSVTIVDGTETKHFSSWAQDNVVHIKDGVETATDTSSSVPTGITLLNIGADHLGANNIIRGWIKKIDYWPEQKSNAFGVNYTTL